VVPRQFLRRLVNQFDYIAENPQEELPQVSPAELLAGPTTVEEQRAAAGKKPIEYEPEPGDDKGYSVEF
jgi:hypothetical protein